MDESEVGPMRVAVRAGAVGGGLLVVLGAAGCNVQLGTPPAAGPRHEICGQDVGRASDRGRPGPFYLDGSSHDVSFEAMAHSAGTWVQVSGDCDRGSVVTVPVSASAALCGQLPAGPDADLAVLVTPQDPGTTSIGVTHSDGSVTRIDVTVTTAIGDDDNASSVC